jgi:hypothetical protein
LALFVYGSTNTALAGNCELLGSGNTHVRLSFTAGSSTTYYIQIFAGNSNLTGGYRLRILPGYGEEGSAWEETTFEPNDDRTNAYLINVGRETPLSAAIEPRETQYATKGPDNDWYRFEAISGRSYAIELFQVSNTLNPGGGACRAVGGDGLALFIYSSAKDPIAGDCQALGSGLVHMVVSFTASSSDTFFIRVFPNNANGSGSYSLRVLPRYDEPGASWDAMFEPNNSYVNAFALPQANGTLLQAAIEARDTRYATNRPDRDWYRLSTVSGQEYTLELLDVETTLTIQGSDCRVVGAQGLAMRVFDPNIRQVARQCDQLENEVGPIHSRLTFTAGTSGDHYIEVFPNGDSSGSYAIRVCAGECPTLDARLYLPLLRR